MDTEELTLLGTSGMVSHLCWLDNFKIIAYCSVNNVDGYYIFDLESSETTFFNNEHLQRDGHPSCSSSSLNGNDFITDCYPDRFRRQSLYKCNIENDTVKNIFDVYSLFKYRGVNRVDFHPRYSECGRYITIGLSTSE